MKRIARGVLGVLILVLSLTQMNASLSSLTHNWAMLGLLSLPDNRDQEWRFVRRRLAAIMSTLQQAESLDAHNSANKLRLTQVARMLGPTDRFVSLFLALPLPQSTLKGNKPQVWSLSDWTINPFALNTSQIDTSYRWTRAVNPSPVSDTNVETCTLRSPETIASQTTVRNLVSNGGFEWFNLASPAGLPSGFSRLYTLQPSSYAVEIVSRDDYHSAVAVLASSYGSSGLLSEWFPVSERSFYLFGGWTSSTSGATPRIAIGWYPDAASPIDGYLIPPEHAAVRCQDGEWLLMAGLLSTPPGTNYARLWLTNTNGVSKFDNVFVIALSSDDVPMD